MRKRIILVIGGIVLLVAGYFGYRFFSRVQAARAAQTDFQTAALERGTLVAQIGASGTVRSNQSAQLAWQTSGTVGEVKVAVGDQVSAGVALAALQPSSSPQNVILAQADLVDAQKALDDLSNSSLQQAQAQQTVEDAQKALDDLLNPQLTLAEAEKAVADAQKAVEEAQSQVWNTQSPADQSYIDEAQAQVTLAKDRLDKAKEKYAPYANKPEDNLKRANLLSQMAQAQQEYDAAVRSLNSLQGTAGPTDQAIAQANLEKAQADLAEAQRNWERVKNGPTEAEIALAEAQLADAQREWERLKNGPDPDDIAAAQARVEAAQATLDQVRIAAPFDGVITQVENRPGDQVQAGTPAFRLDDLSRLVVDVQVSEVDINQVRVGQEVLLTFDSILGKEYHGQVLEVASVGEVQEGVVNFAVTMELTDADEQVKPGMTAAVTITVREMSDVLLIPNRAVRTQEGERVVYVLRNGAPEVAPVTLGRSSDTHSELLEGDLQAGDRIVLNPPTSLNEFGPAGQGGPGNGGPFGTGGGS